MPLHLSTFDGSGETVHPTYAGPPPGWPGAPHYLFVTPYPNGAAADENPSLFAGLDGVTWDTAGQAPNPLVRPTTGYLSDPEVVYDGDRNELFLYYRQVTDSNVIKLIRSKNGVHWDDPVVVVTAPNHTVVSPAVVRRGPSDWLMWSVNAGATGCNAITTTIELRRSSDGITWSAPQTVTPLTQGITWAWHLEVKWIPSRQEYWAVYNAKRPESCATDVLYLATSPDGVTWTTYPSPLLSAGATPMLQDIVYRSTFSYDPVSDVITFWYSGARFASLRYTWGTVMQRRARSEVFAQIGRPAVVSTALARLRPPPLLDPP